ASVPVEFDTCWPWLGRPIVEAVAAIATMEAFLMNVRRVVMSISPASKDGAPARDRQGASSRARRIRIIISPQGGDHEQNHRFSRRIRLRNGAARFFRHLSGVRAGAREYPGPPDGALQDDDERRARPRGDDPAPGARRRNRQRPAPPPRQPYLRLRARRDLRSES